MRKLLSILIVISLLLYGVPIVMPTHAQGSFTAATCGQADVNAVINGPTHTAINGDTIHVPPGTCTWTSGIVDSGVGFTIIGSGTPNTGAGTTGSGTLTTNIIQNTNSPLFAMSAIPQGQTMRVSMLNLAPQAGLTTEAMPLQFDGVCNGSGCANIRVDNVFFNKAYQNDPSQSATAEDNVFGVLDHNTVDGDGSTIGTALSQSSFYAWAGVGAHGDNSFAAADTFGTAQALYIENNLLTAARGTENDVAFTDLGGDRVVVRYNTLNNATSVGLFSSHGTAWTGRDRGSRQKEAYRNTINCTSGGSCGGGNFLSGTGFVFQNTYAATGASFFNQYVSVDNPRKWRAIPPWNYCDGSGGYDNNDGTTYASGTLSSGGTNSVADTSKSWTVNQWFVSGNPYSIHDTTLGQGSEIGSNTATTYTFAQGFNVFNTGDSYQILRASVCLDQPGRGPGVLLSGATPSPTGYNAQTAEPIYEWNDTNSGNFGSPIGIATNSILANRDVYSESSNQAAQSNATTPFNGTSGTGHGTLAFRPSTCTTGVAYWATDQGSWNTVGGGAQGELFKCTGPNTWTLIYTPYTYPNPLTGGGGGGGGGGSPISAPAPSMLAMVATQAIADHFTCQPCPNVNACICEATDGEWLSIAGLPYILMASQGPAGANGQVGATGPAGAPGKIQSITINGVTKSTATPVFTVTGNVAVK